MDLKEKLQSVKDTDIVEIEKKDIIEALKSERESGKIEMKKEMMPIIKTNERIESNPNKLGNFLFNIGKGGLLENQNVMIQYNHTDKNVNTIAEKILKSMSVGDIAAGGAYIPENFSNDLIPVLRNASVLRAAGIQVRPMPNGNLTIRKNTTGSVAYWEGELEAATPSALATGQHKMTAKKLICLVPVSNSLLRFGGDFSFNAIQNDMVAEIARKEDETFLLGAGTANSPKGLRYWANTSNVNAQTGTPDTAKKRADLIKAMALVRAANVPMINPVYMMDSRVKYDLMSAVDSNSTRAFPTIESNNLFGTKVLETNSLMAASTSQVMYADLGHVILGQTTSMTVEFIPNATYSNASGTVIAGTSTDESVFRIILEEDLAVAYDKAISVITGVTWGV